MSVRLQTVKDRFHIVGHSPRLMTAIEIAIQVAPTEVTVLVNGENGTGKDVFSRIIHQYSKRKHMPFIAINCGAIPEGTMDSELFGHEKGSFTSAFDQRKGYFEEVNGGTIFLDEIAEMPLATQSRLLRVLENGEYLRVGSSKVRSTDVRVIAATNKNLIEEIRKGRFREDLYFRLNTVSIHVPPLRERGQDTELLFRWFAEEFAHKYNRLAIQLTSEATDMLYKYRWPGNIREMRNFVEKLTVLWQGTLMDAPVLGEYLDLRDSYLPSLIGVGGMRDGGGEARGEVERLYKLLFDLRDEVAELKKVIYKGMGGSGAPSLPMEDETGPVFVSGTPKAPVFSPEDVAYVVEDENPRTPLLEESLSLEKKEKELIVRALQKFQHNRKKAAGELGISERTLYRKIKFYGID